MAVSDYFWPAGSRRPSESAASLRKLPGSAARRPGQAGSWCGSGSLRALRVGLWRLPTVEFGLQQRNRFIELAVIQAVTVTAARQPNQGIEAGGAVQAVIEALLDTAQYGQMAVQRQPFGGVAGDIARKHDQAGQRGLACQRQRIGRGLHMGDRAFQRIAGWVAEHGGRVAGLNQWDRGVLQADRPWHPGN